MKKTLSLLLILLFFFSLFIINYTKKNSINEEVKKVVEFEKSQYLYRNLKISYDDYKNIYTNIFSKKFNFDEEIIVYTPNMTIRNKDLIGLNLEDIKELLLPYTSKLSADIKPQNIIIDVSDVYLHSDFGVNYVFTKSIVSYDNGIESYITKRYTFDKENSNKVVMLDQSVDSYNKNDEHQNPNIKKEDVLKRLKYQTYYNKPIKYITRILPLKD